MFHMMKTDLLSAHFLVKRLSSFFFAENNLPAEEVKEIEVLSWWNPNKKKYTHLAWFSRRYLSAPPSSIYSERLLSEAGNLYEQKRNRLLPKTGEKLLFFHHNLKKQE